MDRRFGGTSEVKRRTPRTPRVVKTYNVYADSPRSSEDEGTPRPPKPQEDAEVVALAPYRRRKNALRYSFGKSAVEVADGDIATALSQLSMTVPHDSSRKDEFGADADADPDKALLKASSQPSSPSSSAPGSRPESRSSRPDGSSLELGDEDSSIRGDQQLDLDGEESEEENNESPEELGQRLLRTAEATPCSPLAATLDALPIPRLPGALFDLRGRNSPMPAPSSDRALARAVAMLKEGGGGRGGRGGNAFRSGAVGRGFDKTVSETEDAERSSEILGWLHGLIPLVVPTAVTSPPKQRPATGSASRPGTSSAKPLDAGDGDGDADADGDGDGGMLTLTAAASVSADEARNVAAAAVAQSNLVNRPDSATTGNPSPSHALNQPSHQVQQAATNRTAGSAAPCLLGPERLAQRAAWISTVVRFMRVRGTLAHKWAASGDWRALESRALPLPAPSAFFQPSFEQQPFRTQGELFHAAGVCVASAAVVSL